MNEHPPTRRLSSDTGICVVLTLAEASALVTQFQLDPQAAALNGFAKILTALKHVTAEVTSPPSSPLDVPPLRAKHYRRRTEALRMAKASLAPAPTVSRSASAAPEPLRMAKAVLRPKAPTTRSRHSAPAPELDDDYVPYRDEADGIYT